MNNECQTLSQNQFHFQHEVVNTSLMNGYNVPLKIATWLRETIDQPQEYTILPIYHNIKCYVKSNQTKSGFMKNHATYT